MNKVIGYIRVSTEEQAREGVSLKAQEGKIRAYAELCDLGEVEVISDEGKSGKDLRRAGIQRVIKLARDNMMTHLIVYKLDRLTRRCFDLLMLVEEVFKPAGVEFHSITEKIDTASAQGKFFLTITGAISQMERDLISERTKEALQWKKKNGEDLGTPPWGFQMNDKRLEKKEDELEIVGEIKKLRRKRLTFRAIARQLNEQGIPSKQGKSWHPGTVHSILKSQRYKGVKIGV